MAARELPAMMSAHVVFDALDPGQPATLSRRVATDLLRGELGFRGVLLSDDLEMRAIHFGAGGAAVAAVEAGCDAVLVCASEAAQVEAHAALTARADQDAAFRARCEEASTRLNVLRRAYPPRPTGTADVPADVTRALETLR